MHLDHSLALEEEFPPRIYPHLHKQDHIDRYDPASTVGRIPGQFHPCDDSSGLKRAKEIRWGLCKSLEDVEIAGATCLILSCLKIYRQDRQFLYIYYLLKKCKQMRGTNLKYNSVLIIFYNNTRSSINSTAIIVFYYHKSCRVRIVKKKKIFFFIPQFYDDTEW